MAGAFPGLDAPAGKPTVQGAIEEARQAGWRAVEVYGAGRTD